jgi:hypothetical protein
LFCCCFSAPVPAPAPALLLPLLLPLPYRSYVCGTLALHCTVSLQYTALQCVTALHCTVSSPTETNELSVQSHLEEAEKARDVCDSTALHALYCIALVHCVALYCTALNCTTLHCSLHSTEHCELHTVQHHKTPYTELHCSVLSVHNSAVKCKHCAVQ